MAIEHWSQMRQPVTFLGLDAIIIIPLVVLIFRFPYLKWWLFSITFILIVVLIQKVFKYQFRYVLHGIRKFLFGADKRTKKAARNLNF